MFIALADTPGEYRDRCVGDRVHKLLHWFFGLLEASTSYTSVAITEFQEKADLEAAYEAERRLGASQPLNTISTS